MVKKKKKKGKIQKGHSFEILTSSGVLDLKCLRNPSGLKWTVMPKTAFQRYILQFQCSKKGTFLTRSKRGIVFLE